jgi:serine/threonine protein kinase
MTTTVRPIKRSRVQFDVQYSNSSVVNDFIKYCGNISLAKEPLTNINLNYCKIDLQYMRDLRYHPFIVANSYIPHQKLICNVIIDRMMYVGRAYVATSSAIDKLNLFRSFCLAIPTIILLRKQKDIDFSLSYLIAEEEIMKFASVQSCELFKVKSEVHTFPISFYVDSFSIATWNSIASAVVGIYREFVFTISADYLRSCKTKDNVDAGKLAFAAMQCARDCYQMGKINEQDPKVLKFIEIIEKATWGNVPKPSTNIMPLSFSPYEAYEDEARMIGSGSYGSLFVVKLKNSKNEYRVIKKLEINNEQSSTYDYVRERNIMAFMSHDCVLKAYRSFVINFKNAYIEMEFAEIGDLNRVLRNYLKMDVYLNGDNTLEITRAVIYPVIEAVRYLHSFQIVHGDLKLNNIVMTKDYKIKLVDFGLAINALTPTYFDESYTRPNFMYMEYGCRYAPEYSISSMKRSVLSATQFDIWGLGNLVYEIYSILFYKEVMPVSEDEYLEIYSYLEKLCNTSRPPEMPNTHINVPTEISKLTYGLVPIFQAKYRSFNELYDLCIIDRYNFRWDKVLNLYEHRPQMNLSLNSVFPAIDPHKNVALNDVDLYDISSDERTYMMLDRLKEDEYL